MLDYLSRLESLRMRNFAGSEFKFPLNLRKLTLSGNRQPWSKISAIGKLPNVEVLKLCYDSIVGEKWEMEEGEFGNLRFLELSELDIRWWDPLLIIFAVLRNWFCMIVVGWKRYLLVEGKFSLLI